MVKMQNMMPVWGPYSKKYSGISRITDHQTEHGTRFDFVVSPAVANTNTCPPNVTLPVGVHPWTASADYTRYSYRCDLEWKDRIYADVSFFKLSDESVLISTRLVNHTQLPQNCLINYFSALEFPSRYKTVVSLPEKCLFLKANAYQIFSFHTERPWDAQTMDGLHKGEFFDDDFTEHRGLGDRDDNRYILQKFPRFGEEAGDRVVYAVDGISAFSDPVLTIRYQTVGKEDGEFLLNGKKIRFPKTENGLRQITVPICGGSAVQTLDFVSVGCGGIELDFLAVTEKEDVPPVCRKEMHNYVPETETAMLSDGAVARYQYAGVEKTFVLRTFTKNTRFRVFPSGSLEDSPTSRITQPDESFGDMLEQFSGAFSRKHSDDGYYHNAVAHTIFVEPHSERTEYAVLSYGETTYLPVEKYAALIASGAQPEPETALTPAGQPYAFSNRLLRAALFQNVVYPLYLHGDYVMHHTPGKRWDSFYTWDSGFIGLAFAQFAPDLADGILDMYFAQPDNADYAFLLHGSPVPVHIYQYFEMLNHAVDKTALLEYYPRAKRFYDFLAGKINGSVTARFQSGLTTTFDYFYNCSGMDDLPPQKEMYRRQLQRVCAPVISTAQVIRTGKLLRQIARFLGKEADVRAYTDDIVRLTEVLNTYAWDADAGYFSYVVHDADGMPVGQLRTPDGENLNKTMDGVYPLVAGAVTPLQKERLLAHLKNETELFTPVGISAVDRTASYYLTNGYWNGNVWFSHQWFLWKTMLDLGETDFAFKIAETALQAWKREVEYSYYTFEMVSIETGRGGWFHNFGGLSAPVNLWTAAYFLPGTFQTGFDCFCENVQFTKNNTAFSGIFTHSGTQAAALLVVLQPGNSYRVWCNDAEITDSCSVRFDGMLEIPLPAAQRVKMEIQLV